MPNHEIIVAHQPRPGFAPELVGAPTSAGEMRRLVEDRLRADRPRRLRFLVSRLRSREDAEDAFQDFALKAVQGSARVASPDKIDAWLTVCLRNTLFDRYRRRAARRRLEDAVRHEPVDAVTEDGVEEALSCLSQAFENLKPAYRQMIERTQLGQAPLRTLADELGLTATNAAVRLFRARETLRRSMQERCSACVTRCALGARFAIVA